MPQHTGCFGKEIGTKMQPLNKRCVVLSPVAEATRTPDEIMLAIMQSFPSQLSGFLSLLLLKRCFEIWLPFEVSRVQYDIYLRYKPNCLLSRSRPLCLSEPLFPFSQWASSIFPPRSRGASKRCHRRVALLSPPPLPGASGTTSLPWDPIPCPPPRSRGALLKGGWGGGEVPAAEEADCWLTPALLSRKPRRLSISRRLWQGPGARSNPCVRADEPHYPMKYFIITTAVKYWWLLASAECFSRRLSLRVMEPNSSLYTVSDIWKLPKKSKGA